MSSTIWRKDGRRFRDNPEINSLENFASDVISQKQITQLSGQVGDMASRQSATIEITQTEPIKTSEGSIQPQPPPQPELSLPSEIVDICFNGRPAEFRMYGGFIRYLD